jgi:hypothetical protein
MKIRQHILLIIALLLLVSCGAKRKATKLSDKDLKTQIEERMIELTCECIEPQNNGLSKKEYEDIRDNCIRGSFPTIASEFQISEENNPYGGMMQMLAAFDRIKDGLKDNCPRKE